MPSIMLATGETVTADRTERSDDAWLFAYNGSRLVGVFEPDDWLSVSQTEIVAMAEPVRPRRAKPKATKRKPPPGGELVTEIADFIGKYVVMSDAARLVTALFVIHTHAADAAEQTPYLAVSSPEKQCGKSRLLETLQLLVRRGWLAITPSEAVIYRVVDSQQPTLLLDEYDTIFNPRMAEKYEPLRALLNAGHRRGAKIPRCIGNSNEPQEFSPFCPKVLAGIGTLPDTIADRSIPVRLERKRRDEPVERFRLGTVEPLAKVLHDRIAAWAKDNKKSLAKALPAMPDDLSDRMQEGCEPLAAIADRLGCGAEARAALVELLTNERLDSQETMRLRLLRDIKTVMEASPAARAVTTDRLITRLVAIEEAPWGSFYGRDIEARDLASLLGHFGIKPTTVNVKVPGQGRVRAKGYRRDDLAAAWERYLD